MIRNWYNQIPNPALKTKRVRYTPLPSRNRPQTFMTSGKCLMFTIQNAFISSLKFCICAFHNALKVSSIKYGFALLILIASLGRLPVNSGTDQFEMLVLFHNNFILTLPADWTMFNVISSNDVNRNFDNITTVWFTLKIMLDRRLTLILMFVSNFLQMPKTIEHTESWFIFC